MRELREFRHSSPARLADVLGLLYRPTPEPVRPISAVTGTRILADQVRLPACALVLLLVVVGCSAQPAPGPVAAPHDHATTATRSCPDPAPPIGALAPAVPAWCIALAAGVDSAVRRPNSWTDEFRSGAVNAHLAASYRVFELGRSRASSVFLTQHFAHNGHWMVDVAGHGAPLGLYPDSVDDFEIGPNNGGAFMRPDTAFRFADGRLVVEFEVAAMRAYGDHAWPEVVITTAAAPTPHETNGWYAAGVFGGYPVVACGVPADRLSECRVYDHDTITAHLNASSAAGAAFANGGAPTTAARDAAWRTCAPDQADELCRDRFQLVLERDAITLSVNGVPYMEHRGLPTAARVPDELLRSDVYVYFASWTYLGDPAVVRFHWGRIAINP